MNELPISVVLADDHPAVRAGIRQFIERDATIQVIAEAGDGAAALELIRQHRPRVAVVDLQMPRLTGLEVIAQAHKEQLPTAFVVLTAYDDDPYIFAALRAIRLVNAGQPALDPGVTARVIARMGAPGSPPHEPERPSERELAVLRLAGQGLTNRAIGHALGISERTVHSHLINIFGKLAVNNRTEAVLRAVRMGWIALDN